MPEVREIELRPSPKLVRQGGRPPYLPWLFLALLLAAAAVFYIARGNPLEDSGALEDSGTEEVAEVESAEGQELAQDEPTPDESTQDEPEVAEEPKTEPSAPMPPPASPPPPPTSPSMMQVRLESVPPAATVSVDGTFRGTTPLVLDMSPGGQADVEVSKAGYQNASRTVAAADEKVVVELVAELGEVRFVVRPAGAELLIDGKSYPQGEALSLPTISQQVEVHRAGYETARQEVTPLPGVAQVVEINLKSLEQLREEAQPALLKTAEGHELHRIEPRKEAFQMGASRREPGRRANEVLRDVRLTRPFYLAAHEVTNEQFRRFRPEHDSGSVAGSPLNLDGQPVARVTWQEAAAYCNWLSAQEGLPPVYAEEGSGEASVLRMADPHGGGYRLPTEAEWAWTARYPDGLPRKYSWGDTLPVPQAAGNFGDASASTVLPGVMADYRDGHATTAPPGSFSANPLGLFDLSGNVAEWVGDFYAIGMSPREVLVDPLGPAKGDYHVIRGASWMQSNLTELRLSYRDYGKKARPDVGFRVARTLRLNSDSNEAP